MTHRGPEAAKAKAGVREKAQLMSASEIDRTLVRLAHEILERNKGVEGLVLVGGGRRRGPLASRLAQKVSALAKGATPVGILDTTFYRDDLSTIDQKPALH